MAKYASNGNIIPQTFTCLTGYDGQVGANFLSNTKELFGYEIACAIECIKRTYQDAHNRGYNISTVAWNGAIERQYLKTNYLNIVRNAMFNAARVTSTYSPMLLNAIPDAPLFIPVNSIDAAGWSEYFASPNNTYGSGIALNQYHIDTNIYNTLVNFDQVELSTTNRGRLYSALVLAGSFAWIPVELNGELQNDTLAVAPSDIANIQFGTIDISRGHIPVQCIYSGQQFYYGWMQGIQTQSTMRSLFASAFGLEISKIYFIMAASSWAYVFYTPGYTAFTNA